MPGTGTRESVNKPAAANPSRITDTPPDESTIDTDAAAKTEEGEETTAANSQGRVNEEAAGEAAECEEAADPKKQSQPQLLKQQTRQEPKTPLNKITTEAAAPAEPNKIKGPNWKNNTKDAAAIAAMEKEASAVSHTKK